ncbi:MAG: succinate dehydrogenase / fumarate reductase membrane anchor subunit [Gammaproteobacteria bacterium]|jgi:succinate dehydrogenase / fumarate reductase membrane anchor subunit
MKFRTALNNVRGLGSAKSGTHHFWMQRVTALALVPLMLWLSWSMIGLAGLDHAAALAWVGAPTTAVLLISTLVALIYHADLGLQVIIEDYVHAEGVKFVSLIALRFVSVLLALASVLAVLRISLAG